MNDFSKKRFFDFLFNDYISSSYEEFPENDSRFWYPKMTYAIKNRERFYIVLKYALKYIQPTTPLKILDLGVYPGTLIRIISQYLKEYKFEFYGVGIHITPDFVDIMGRETNTNIYTVNLDPQNYQLRNKGYPTEIPIKDNTIDLAFALEIVEHLTSPIHMLTEIHRVLKKKGKIIITTPNVTRIGSVFKLIIGKTNYDRLMPVDYYNEEDEWRPHFREYSMGELVNFLVNTGFEVVEKVFFVGNNTYFNVKSIKQKLIDLAKIPFYIIPHLKGSILIIGEKND